MQDPDCLTLVRYFDELNETHNRIPNKEFKQHLVRWGVPKESVKAYMRKFDPNHTGYVSRQQLCNALNCYPNSADHTKDVYVVESDMTQHKRDSVIKVILEEMQMTSGTKDRMYQVKQRLEKLYGQEWNVYCAEGLFYGFTQYKPGSNLCFIYHGVTYGVFQTPAAKAQSSNH